MFIVTKALTLYSLREKDIYKTNSEVIAALKYVFKSKKSLAN